MSKLIIGLAGVKTSGKSTVANVIKDMAPNAVESALADKLKNTCAEVFNLERNQFDAQELKEVPFLALKTLTRENIESVLTSFGVQMSDTEFDEKYSGIIGLELDTPRRIAQIVGTEILRATGNPDIHCDNVNTDGDIVIISDLRFPNEFEYFKRLSQTSLDVEFVPLYIQRDTAEIVVDENSHPSEKSVFLFRDGCIKVDNNGTIEDTSVRVRSLLFDYIYKGERNVAGIS